MKIAIITNTKNSLNLLKITLSSVLAASKVSPLSVDHLIWDSNSTDSTEKYISRFKKGVTNRNYKITYDRGSDNGLYDSLAFTLPKVDADIVSYLNAGDIYFDSTFNILEQVFSNINISWITGIPTQFILSENKFKFFYPRIYRSNNIKSGCYGGLRFIDAIQQESTFWRPSLHEEVPWHQFSKFRFAGDFFLWKTFAEKHKLSTVVSRLASFTIHEGQISSTFENYSKEFKRIANPDNISLPQKYECYRDEMWCKIGFPINDFSDSGGFIYL